MKQKSKTVPVEPMSVEDVTAIFNDKPGITGAFTVEPVVLDIVKVERPVFTETIDLTPIHAAAERAGLSVTSLAIYEGTLTVACGPHVPPFIADTVEAVVAQINLYNCKHCGTGGGHTPNCGRPR